MRSKHFALLAGAMIVLAVFASAAAASNWTQFQADEKNTGVTSDNGPDDGTIAINQSISVSNGMIDTVPVILGDYVYVEGASKLFKYNKYTGASAGNLTVTAGGFMQNACPASDGDNIIYVVDTGYGHQPKITAVYASNMSEKWNTSFATVTHQCSCPVTYYNDNGVEKLFVGTCNMSGTDPVNLTDDGTYFAFYTCNGTEIWNRPTTTGGGYYWAGAAVVGDFIVYADDEGTLTSVYICNGTRANEIDVSANQIRSSVTYNADDNLVYVAGKDKYVRSVEINPSTGIFGTSDSYKMAKGSTSTPAYNAADDRIYVACGAYNAGRVYCLNATTLAGIWNVDLGHKIQCAPAVADDGTNDPLVFVTSNDDSGICFRIKDNGATATYTSVTPAINNTYSLPGVAISGDHAYFGNDDGYLYIVE